MQTCSSYKSPRDGRRTSKREQMKRSKTGEKDARGWRGGGEVGRRRGREGEE